MMGHRSISAPSPEAILEQVKKIVESQSFVDSPRSRKFLEYIVREYVKHGPGAIKESVIAVEVFEKDWAFDGRLISTVRSGANRLRKKLRDYYSTEGQDDLLLIDLPEGAYVPHIAARCEEPTRTPEPQTDKAEETSPQPDITAGDPHVARAQSWTATAQRALAACFTSEAALWSVATVTGVAASLYAIFTSAYAVTALLYCISVIFTLLSYRTVEDTPQARGAISVFVIAVMSYIPSATTLTEVVDRVVNMTSIPPAAAYPFVTGLKFIPLFTVVFAYWILLGLFGDEGFRVHRQLGSIYILLGIACILGTWAGGITVDPQPWYGQVPGSGNLRAGYAAVLGLNLIVWLVGYWFFRKERICSYRKPLLLCGAAYIPLAVIAGLTDHQYNEINKHYLDLRHPSAYIAANPDAIEKLQGSHGQALRSKLGPRLEGMLESPDFRHALRTKVFYKQPLDEAFQARNHAVIYGYKRDLAAAGEAPEFVTVRFPEELAEALRFQPRH